MFIQGRTVSFVECGFTLGLFIFICGSATDLCDSAVTDCVLFFLNLMNRRVVDLVPVSNQWHSFESVFLQHLIDFFVEVVLQRNDESKEVFLERFFRIDKIVEKIRDGQNENSQVVLLHLVEEIAYESRYLNVNKSYSGTPYRIIKNIIDTYCTDYTLYGPPFDVQDMQVIVPNMTPLDAACWIKNRATNADGYPFFLFSTISHPLGGQKGLIMMDLDVMMKQKVWNDDMPYNNFASTQVERSVSARRTIKKFEHRSGEDFRKLLDKGLLGARHILLS